MEPSQQQNSQPDLNEESISRRGFFPRLLESSLRIGAGVVFGGGGIVLGKKYNHQSTYGTLANPQYPITKLDGYGDVFTYRAYALGRIFELESRLRHPEQGEAHLLADNVFRVRARRPAPVGTPLDEESVYGPSPDYAVKIFKALTGKDIPPGTTLKIGKLEAGIAGVSKFLTGEVIAGDAAYWEEVSTFDHELGHLANQQIESVFFGNPFSRFSNQRELFLREEAAAYAFEIAATWAIEDPYLRNMGIAANNAYRREFIEDHFSSMKPGGVKDSGYHAEAVAIADAALTLHGNPAVAYNALATTTDYDPQIQKIIEQNFRLHETERNLWYKLLQRQVRTNPSE